MKKIAIFALAAYALVSCGSFAQTASSVAATTAATAQATSELIQNDSQKTEAATQQVKAQTIGKIDLSNMTNLLNVAIVVNAAQTIKDQTEGSQYYKDFAKGLIVGSNELVSEATVGNVIAGVTALAGVDVKALQGKGDNAAAKGVTAAENVANIASSVSILMSLFQ